MAFRVNGKKIPCKLCERPSMGRSLCSMHYYRAYRDGTLNEHPKHTADSLFEERIDKTSDCWIWLGYKNAKGYGELILGNHEKKSAHRFAYEKYKGAVPSGMVVMHSCDNPACVNPSHLSIGTQADNMLDCLSKGRTTKGTKNARAKLTDQQIPAIRSDPRPQHIIAKEYGVNQNTISCIKRRVRWKHING